MALPSPEDIRKKADSAYKRFLKKWIAGEGGSFFPWPVKIAKTLDYDNYSEMIAASEKLESHSKEVKGWGYSIQNKTVRSRSRGTNPVPSKITFDTLEDLLRFIGKQKEFVAASQVARRLRESHPELEQWLVENVNQLHKYADKIDDLLKVTRYFADHINRDLHVRQLPIEVDTKFIEKNFSVLRLWLDQLFPSAVKYPTETDFARRYGLRVRQPHRAIRFLDENLQVELGVRIEELSLPLESLQSLPVTNTYIFIVEKRVNLNLLPAIKRGLAIRGEGNAVTRLQLLSFLHENPGFLLGRY
ncbi:MAG: hypothetical protein KDA65_07425 [Planctomycetaceae bacterium]|nr:hypothetical protein [Planctomycetaceae bacterium]